MPPPAEEDSILIRSVAVSDAESILEILNPIIARGSLTSISHELSLQQQMEFLSSFPSNGIFLAAVCQSSKRLIGLQDVIPHRVADTTREGLSGEITTFVALRRVRQGIGKLLSRHTLGRANALGYGLLQATVRRQNTAAQTFYASQGFRFAEPARTATERFENKQPNVVIETDTCDQPSLRKLTNLRHNATQSLKASSRDGQMGLRIRSANNDMETLTVHNIQRLTHHLQQGDRRAEGSLPSPSVTLSMGA